MIAESVFKQELTKLNSQQKLAVDTLEGPVLVYAGPGTGKTQVLTLRIANLIAQGLAEPREILALTFTNVAAANMRERLTQLIGATAAQVSFHTFHSFCSQVITNSREYFPISTQAQLLADLPRLRLMEDIITTLPLKVLRPAGKKFYYLKELIATVSTLKKEGVDQQAFADLVARAKHDTEGLIEQELAKKKPGKGKLAIWEKTLAKQAELVLVYQAYQEQLVKNHFYDYDDLIMMVRDGFASNPDLLATYQEQYHYFLVDEYQDTNNAQAQVLSQLASYWGEDANVFVVGDPQQSIYRFQGANLENFLAFGKRYPHATTITLDTGYRCSQVGYTLAHELITNYTTPDSRLGQKQPLVSNQKAKALPVTTTVYPHRDLEVAGVLGQIKNLITKGVNPSEIAVIYRNNQEAVRWRELAAVMEIPFQSEASINGFTQSAVVALLELLRLIDQLEDPYASEDLGARLLWQPFLALPQLAVLQLQAGAKRLRRLVLPDILAGDLSALMSLMEADESLTTAALTPAVQTQLSQLGQLLLKYHQLAITQPLRWWFKNLLADFHLLPIPETWSAWESVVAYYAWERILSEWEQATPGLTLAQALAGVTTMQEHGLILAVQPWQEQTSSVIFTTAHQAKGREWEYVFITGLQRSNWDKTSKRQLIPLPAGILQEQLTTEFTDDNTRLFYVALTRAGKQARVSWHERDLEQAESAKEPSIYTHFLNSQPASLVLAHQAALETATMLATAQALLQPAPVRIFSEEVKQFFASKVKQLVLSPTMLNDYLADQEQFMQRHLLATPDFSVSVSREFGNSCHLVLEKAVRAKLADGQFMSAVQMQTLFRQNFGTKDLPEPEKSGYLEIGLTSLTAYCDNHFQDGDAFCPLACEKNLGSAPPLSFEGIPVRGKIDRLDLLDEKTKLVRVVDYKTGSAVSPAVLAKGNPKLLSEREQQLPECLRSAAKRQLLFYKLLLDLDPTFPYQVTTGALDYLKVTSSAKPKFLEIPLLEDEVKQLQELIKTVWQEIQDLQFLTPTTV